MAHARARVASIVGRSGRGRPAGRGGAGRRRGVAATAAALVVLAQLAGLSTTGAVAATAAAGPAMPGRGQDLTGPAPRPATAPARPGRPALPSSPQAKPVTPPAAGRGSSPVGSSFARVAGLPVSVASSDQGSAVLASHLPASASAEQRATAKAGDDAAASTARRLAAVKPPARAGAPAPEAARAAAAAGVRNPRTTSRWPSTSTADTPAPSAAPLPGVQAQRVQVTTLDPSSVSGLGGFLGFRVARADGGSDPASVAVRLDVSAVDGAYGGAYADRLQLVRYPACALTTPALPACSRATPVPSRVDPGTHTLTAVVTAQADGTVPDPAAVARENRMASRGTARAPLAALGGGLLAAATPNDDVYAVTSTLTGGSGTFGATAPSPSDGWATSEQSGSFQYSYPLPAAPSSGGRTPALALAYDSGSVDGLTSHENSQSSPVGLGWGLAVPYIEQQFKPCTGSGLVGNLCWAGGVSSLSLDGRSSRLVYQFSNSDGSVDSFGASDDQGWRVERVFAGSANPNGDAGGVYWKVTTTDGMQYFFGRQNTDWSTTANNSTLTDPLYAQSSGDVCWGNTFTDNAGGSHANACRMAYRWNLAYVVDPVGNLQTWQYLKDVSSYALTGSVKAQSYDSAGYLASVSYGFTTSNAKAAPAPQQISLGYGWRCDFSGCRAPVTHDAYAADYPDVPLDLWCYQTAKTCSQGPTSPAYFYLRKLESVTSTTWNGSAYVPAEKVSLDVGWPRYNSWQWSAVMWLSSITKTGYSPSGASASLPSVSFDGEYDTWLPNRYDDTPVAGWHQEKPRVTVVHNELGGTARVTYGQPNDCGSQTLDGNEDRQTTDCFPALEPDRHEAWFRRYLVTRLDVVDAYGAPTQTTTYDYDTTTGAGWHSDNDPVVPAGDQRWSDYRGYAKVKITTGTPGGTTSTTQKRFFRGLNRDHKADGSSPSVTVNTASGLGDPTSGVTYPDHFFLRGMPLEERVLHADGSEESATQHEYGFTWVTTHDDGPYNLDLDSVVQAREVLTRHMQAAQGTVRRYKNVTHQTYDGTYGLPVSTQDDGDPVSGTGATCAYRTYTRNTAAWVLETVASDVSAVGACPADGSAPAASALLSRTDRYYDAGFASLTAAPTAGLVTREVAWASASGTGDAATSITATRYDAYGRPTGRISPDNAVPSATTFATAGTAATVAYTTTGGAVIAVTATNETGMTVSKTIDPGTGQVLSTADQNGRTTTLTYDPLGRLTNVRLPGDSFDAKTFAYTVSGTSPSTVLTSLYPEAGATPVRTWQFYDSLGRASQSQTTGPTGGTITTGTRYDDRGKAAATVSAFGSSAAPGTAYGQWYDPAFTATLPAQTVTAFDDLGRAVTSSLVSGGTTKWSATTSYSGTTATTTPPSDTGAGEPDLAATAATSDLHGHTVNRAQGGNATTYGYDVAGRLVTATSPMGAVTRYGYDWLGRRTSAIEPDAGNSSSDYYPSGHVRHTRDGAGKELYTAQDLLGRVTTTYAGASTSGTLTDRTTYDGTPLGGSGPLLGTVTSRTRYDGANAFTEAFGYDARYRKVRDDRTVPSVAGSPLQYVGGTYTATTAYDGLDRPVSVTYPAAGGLPAETVTTGYSDSYPTTLSSPLATYVADTQFTAVGQVASRVLGVDGAVGSVRATNTWDVATGRLTGQAAVTPSTGTSANVRSDTYAYTPGGGVSKVTDQVAGQQECFTYDPLGRLTAASTSAASAATGNGCTADGTGPSPYTESYAYDADGDLTSLTSAGATTTFGYGSNAGLGVTGGPHALTSVTKGTTVTAFGYDGSGQLVSRGGGTTTATFVWNAEHRLTSTTAGGGTSTFTDGADGARWVRSTADETVVSLQDQEVHLAAGATSAAAATGVRYYGLGSRVAERRTGTGPALSWLLPDRQDSVCLAVDAGNGAVARDRYLPYGGDRAAPGQVPGDRGWIGGVQDGATGLDYLNARYYDPVTAHFLTTDPLVDQSSAQVANPYAYGSGDPEQFSDPSGQYIIKAGDNWFTIAKLEGISNPSANNWLIMRVIFGPSLPALATNHYLYVPAVDGPRPGTPTLSNSTQTAHSKELTEETKILNSFEAKYEADACHDPVSCAINKLHAYEEGQAAKLLQEAFGAKCEKKFGMEICYGGPAMTDGGRSGITIGHIYFTTATSISGIGESKIQHEKVHAQQWDKYGDAFNVLYFEEGAKNPCRNGWEIQAGIDKGGYRKQCG